MTDTDFPPGPSTRLARRHVTLAALLGCTAPATLLAAGTGQPEASSMTLTFRGIQFLHRWSRDGQHEFTPADSADLGRWQDMLTLNVHDAAGSGEQLADVANRVLGNYQRHGKILQTRSTPRTAERPAEHFIAAVLGNRELLEAVFARCLLRDGAGLVAVVSHRVYGQAAGPAMSSWLGANGRAVDDALMAWSGLPRIASLRRLPASAAR